MPRIQSDGVAEDLPAVVQRLQGTQVQTLHTAADGACAAVTASELLQRQFAYLKQRSLPNFPQASFSGAPVKRWSRTPPLQAPSSGAHSETKAAPTAGHGHWAQEYLAKFKAKSIDRRVKATFARVSKAAPSSAAPKGKLAQDPTRVKKVLKDLRAKGKAQPRRRRGPIPDMPNKGCVR